MFKYLQLKDLIMLPLNRSLEDEEPDHQRIRQIKAQENLTRRSCLACTNEKFGIKTRKIIPHTCKDSTLLGKISKTGHKKKNKNDIQNLN